MAIITNFICDVSGKSSTNKCDFVDVKIHSSGYKPWYGTDGHYYNDPTKTMTIQKLVHIDVALKLGLIPVQDNTAPTEPEVTFESKLSTLLKDYINDLVEESVSESVSQAMSNR